jgi:hypothetical protein
LKPWKPKLKPALNPVSTAEPKKKLIDKKTPLNQGRHTGHPAISIFPDVCCDPHDHRHHGHACLNRPLQVMLTPNTNTSDISLK